MAQPKFYNTDTSQWEPLTVGVAGPQGPPGPQGNNGTPAPEVEDSIPQVPLNHWISTQRSQAGANSAYTPVGAWTFGEMVLLPAGLYTELACYIRTGVAGAGVRLGLVRLLHDGTTNAEVLGETAQIPAATSLTVVSAAMTSPVAITKPGLYYVVCGNSPVNIPSFEAYSVSNYGWASSTTTNAYTRVVRYSTADSYTSGFTAGCISAVAGTNITFSGMVRRGAA